MNNYQDFQNQSSSSKIVLATIDGARRLMGWESYDTFSYKLTVPFNEKVVVELKDGSTPYTENTTSSSHLNNGEYYVDRINNLLILRPLVDGDPNDLFISVTVRFFFANQPVVIAHDLDSGFEVLWEPALKTTSQFGNNIDTINQVGESIDGTGSIQILNDRSFWTSNFDKWTYDNKRCQIYSWNQDLELDQAQIIFDGFITDKKYSAATITFQLKDQFKEIRQPVVVPNISELELRAGEDQDLYKQRMVFGRVFGHRPINVDRELDGYPLIGTVMGAIDPVTFQFVFNFIDTQFLSQVSPSDVMIIAGAELEVETVTNNYTVTFADEIPLSQAFDPMPIYLRPNSPRRYMNRVWSVVGHTVREPETACLKECTIDKLLVESNRDIYPNDIIYVGEPGAGTRVRVRSLSGTQIVYLATSLGTAPTEGTRVIRPAIQNVRVGQVNMAYERDYSFDAETGILTFTEDAELNAGPLVYLGFDVTFTNGSRTVTGSGLSALRPGYAIGQAGVTEMFIVQSIIDDTSLLLVEASTFSGTALGRYKDLVINEDSNTIVSCDLLGMTEDGTKEGILVKTAPQICNKLLHLSPLNVASINDESFERATEVVYHEIGIVVPESYSDEDTPTYVDVMNEVNKSVFGALIIIHNDQDTQINYHVLQAQKERVNTTRFTESDFLGTPVFDATSKYTVKDILLEYQHREYNPAKFEQSNLVYVKSNQTSQLVVGTENQKRIVTRLVTELDARMVAGRWSFILSDSMGMISFKTKLQGAKLHVGSIIEVEHEKLFYRTGSSTRRLFMVESMKTNGYEISIEAVDFSNTFNRVANITEIENTYDNATETELLYGGFITDAYGMQDNDSDTFGTNLIW